jgi:hypothetical protein
MDGIRAQVISWVAYVVVVGAVFNAMDRDVDEAADPHRVIGSTVWVSLLVSYRRVSRCGGG